MDNKQFTPDQAWDLIDDLMHAAGRLSDCQEIGVSRQVSDLLNEAKKKIFDVQEALDPRL